MQISRRTRSALVALGTLTAASLLAACSSSSAGGPGTASSATTPGTSAGASTNSGPATNATTSTAATTGSASGALDKTALSALLLTQADLPAGWTASPAQTSADDGAAQSRFAKCVGIRDTHADKVAEADSQEFTNRTASISSSASSYSSAADVLADEAAFRDAAKATSCMVTMLRSQMSGQLPNGATLDDINLAVRPGRNGGPANVIATISGTIKVTASGKQFDVYIDSTYIAGKQVEAEVDFESFSAPADAALQRKLVNAVAQRVAGA